MYFYDVQTTLCICAAAYSPVSSSMLALRASYKSLGSFSNILAGFNDPDHSPYRGIIFRLRATRQRYKVPTRSPPDHAHFCAFMDFTYIWKTSCHSCLYHLEATEQDQVRAPAPGTIVFSGTVVDRQVVVIEHPNGYRSSFEPVTEPLPVGTHVQAGQVIARVDAYPTKPRCSTTCLYWSVRRGGDHKNGSGKNAEYINPMLLLGPAEPTILLPIDESFKA